MKEVTCLTKLLNAIPNLRKEGVDYLYLYSFVCTSTQPYNHAFILYHNIVSISTEI
jgi:hypothetical protein